MIKIYFLILLSTIFLFSSCREKVIKNHIFSAKDLKNSIRICFKDRMFNGLAKYEKSKGVRIITNYKLSDTVQIDSTVFYINPTHKADSSLYKFSAIVTYPVKNEATVVFENQYKPHSFLIRLQNTLNFSFKNEAWELTRSRSVILD